MFRTLGYVSLVLLIGTFAIAWSHHQQTGGRAETLTPDTMHQRAGSLPVQQVHDMTFIYTHEK
jgi:hypothetical protein